MKKFSKLLMILCLVLIVFMNINTVAYADDKKTSVTNLIQQTCIVNSDGSIRYTNGTVKAYVSEKADASHTEAVTLSDGKTIVYYNASSLDFLAKQANKINENKKVNEKVNGLTNDVAIEANTGAASTMLSGFKPILELLIGVIVILITFGMTFFSALDICFIAFPVLRNKCEDAKQSGNPIMTKKSANGDVSLRWISDDAQYAIQQGTIDSGKSPWGLYFKKRVVSYIFLGITIFILLTGNISIITNIAINVVSGIVDIISGLAS